MNFLFAWRYFKSKKTTNAINIISWVSITAIAVVSAALIIVLSVFNGFEDLVKGLYSDFYADVRIIPAKGKQLKFNDAQFAILKNYKGIESFSCIVEEKAVLVNGDYQSIVFLKGVDDKYITVNKLVNHIVRGKYALGDVQNPQLLLGAGVENAIATDVETAINGITIYMPNKKSNLNLSGLDAFNSFNAATSGTFLVQQEFDNKYAFTNINFAKYMLDFGENDFTNIELKLNNDAKAKSVKNELQKVLGKEYLVETRYEQNKSLYAVMQMEKWIIYGVLVLILIIAAFNVIGALTMLVLEKQKDIHILKAMGASDGLVQKIFLTEGILLATLGGFGGILIATIVCLIQIKFKLIKIGGSSFIIDYYPVKLNALDYLLSISAILIIAIAAACLPARKASLQPLDLKS